jgi:nucleoid-associated protein YgaU
MTQPEKPPGGNKLRELLLRKFYGIPVIVYALIGIGLLAWYLHKRQQAQQQNPNAAMDNNVQVFPDAQPMNYSNDIFVNVPDNDTPVPGPTGPPGPPGPTGPPAPTPTPIPTPVPPPRQTSVTYVVQPGDTLWGIATRFLGAGAKYPLVYAANKATIEATAHQHGFSSSNNGSRIWPGEKLVIPK